MRFDEPDTRDAYRRGAQDVLESLESSLTSRQNREFKSWLQELESWQEFDPPPPPSPSFGR
jgi:hypothetical protein